jgi:hypothetical protein
MAIVTISNVSYAHGRKVAETLAEKLGYAFFTRDTIREDASNQFNLPEIKIASVIENPPSLLDRITGGKEKYVAYVRSVFLRRLQKDNIIYLGYVGQFFVKDVPNILKVLITAQSPIRGLWKSSMGAWKTIWPMSDGNMQRAISLPRAERFRARAASFSQMSRPENNCMKSSSRTHSTSINW